jgi:methylase of polypeptide subunit release factors
MLVHCVLGLLPALLPGLPLLPPPQEAPPPQEGEEEGAGEEDAGADAAAAKAALAVAQRRAMQTPRAADLRATLQAYYAAHAPKEELAKVENLVARLVGGPPSEVGGMMLGGVLWPEEGQLYAKLQAKYGAPVVPVAAAVAAAEAAAAEAAAAAVVAVGGGEQEGREGQVRRRSLRVLDLGTGSGALLLAVLHHAQAALGPAAEDAPSAAVPSAAAAAAAASASSPSAAPAAAPAAAAASPAAPPAAVSVVGVGVELSLGALAVAETNARALGLRRRVRFQRADFGTLHQGATRKGLAVRAAEGAERGEAGAEAEAGEQQFDLVLCNPPYLPQGMRQEHVAPHLMYEPAEALFAGARGMAAYQAIGESMAQCARPLLRAGGFMVVEVGMGVDQAFVAGLFRPAGLVPVADAEGMRAAGYLARAPVGAAGAPLEDIFRKCVVLRQH